jgi:hypothetical protein
MQGDVCPVCLKNMNASLITNCGHEFCSKSATAHSVAQGIFHSSLSDPNSDAVIYKGITLLTCTRTLLI